MSKSDIDEHERAILEKLANVRIGVNMTPKEVFNFLLKLASDDDFRAAIEKNPNEALAQYHVYVPSHDVPFHVTLPPKGQLQQALMDMLTGDPGVIPALPFNVDPMFWWFIDFLIFLAMNKHKKKNPTE